MAVSITPHQETTLKEALAADARQGVELAVALGYTKLDQVPFPGQKMTDPLWQASVQDAWAAALRGQEWCHQAGGRYRVAVAEMLADRDLTPEERERVLSLPRNCMFKALPPRVRMTLFCVRGGTLREWAEQEDCLYERTPDLRRRLRGGRGMLAPLRSLLLGR
jgi:hypothetical protein